MPSAQEQSIFRTLAYFAYQKYALTSFEVWKWCNDAEMTLNQVDEMLRTSAWLHEHGALEDKGFWGLGDIETWRNHRVHCMTDALRKSRRAKRFAAVASWIPWVSMIAVCNSLAYGFTTPQSDIDLFVVTKCKRLWLTRLVLTGALAMLRLRPGETNHDPLCLSFFVDEDHLDLAPMKLSGDDPYLLRWVASLAPVFDRNDVMAKIHAVNRWIRPLLPHDCRVRRATFYAVKNSHTLPDIGWGEGFAERVQRARFPEVLKSAMNQDTRVVVADGVLKFHEKDRREIIRNEYYVLCQSAGVLVGDR